MSSPVATVPSPSSRYEKIKSTILSNESPSTPDSSMSLMDNSQSPDQSIISSRASDSFRWMKTFDELCQWTNRTVKLTRQYLQERLGQSPRTHDFQLEEKIQSFHQIKSDYEQIWKVTQQMVKHLTGIIQTQQGLKECFFELEQRKISSDEELRQTFLLNGRSQQILADQGYRLRDSLNKFLNGLETLITKTMEDTSMTIRHYERSRMEYDAYRLDYENVLSRNHTGGVSLSEKELSIEKKYYLSKQSYEKYQKDLQVKLNFLDENRKTVMKQQLESFQRSIEEYFSQTHHRISSNE